VGLDPRRQLHPGMPAAVVDRNLRRRKARVGKRANGDAHGRVLVAFLGVEHGRSANRAEAEPESGALVAGADVLGCGAMDRVGRCEAGERRKHTTRLALTGEAMTNADFAWLAVNFDAQLAAGAGGGSGGHGWLAERVGAWAGYLTTSARGSVSWIPASAGMTVWGWQGAGSIPTRYGRGGGHPRKFPHMLGEVSRLPTSASMTK